MVPYSPFVEAFESYVLANEEVSNSTGSRQSILKTLLTTRGPAEGFEAKAELSPQAWKDQKFAAWNSC